MVLRNTQNAFCFPFLAIFTFIRAQIFSMCAQCAHTSMCLRDIAIGTSFGVETASNLLC